APLYKKIRDQKLSKQIPKILHFIWLGDSPLPEASRQNFSFFSKSMRKLDGISVLWTDQVEIKLEFRNWLKENAIVLINVGAVFSSKDTMATFYHFRAALAKIPSNFGEASDLLRYEIIDRFGGYYFDHDVKQGDIDLATLLSKGKNSPYGFVCGQCSLKAHARNDLFGAVPQSTLIKAVRDLVLSNYNKKSWKSYIGYKRSFLTDFTVFTTGPEVFNEGLKQVISQGRELSNKQKMEIGRSIFVISTVGDSAESWVYNHTKPQPIKFSSNEDRLARIKHDLMLNLLYEGKILDLEKYQLYLEPGDQAWLISLVGELLKEYPGLIEFVDRIFIGDVHLYCHLQQMLEKGFNKKITWNELAVLKFACVMEKHDLVKLLMYDRGVSPLDSTFADVGYYDCSHAQPLGILLETGNLETIARVVNASTVEEIHKSFIPKELGLIYVGSREWAACISTASIPKMKIEQLERKKKRVFEGSAAWKDIDLQISSFLVIERLLRPFLEKSTIESSIHPYT
ncbi:MAG TPA: hypothetical protein VGO47_12715, partial [Chlamydiales bacterium]|nr:hypothetical protein [Chlamydiales bacterium]